MRSRWAILISALFFIWALPSRAATPPAASELLKQILEPPAVPYEGQMNVTRWYGKHTRAQELRVFFSPPNRYRWEFLSPGGALKRLMISDGEKEKVQLIAQRKILVGDAAKTYEKQMSEEKEAELLFKNYRAFVSGPEKIIGREAWVLEFQPIAEGKAHERLWIDKETRVILSIKKFHLRGTFAAVSRFTRFEPRKVPDSLFELEPASGTTIDEHGLDPDFLSLDELKRATGKSVQAPPELPGGFIFESADFFDVKSHTVRYLRYTDGLAVLSIFETDRPVQRAEAAPADSPAENPGTIRLASLGKVISKKVGRRYYTFMGDLPAGLFSQILAQFH